MRSEIIIMKSQMGVRWDKKSAVEQIRGEGEVTTSRYTHTYTH